MILDTLSTAASGGLLGLCGSMVNKIFTMVQAMQQSRAREQDFGHRKALLELTHQHQLERAEKNLQRAQQQADAAIQQASYQHDTQIGQGALWVINTLRLVRPLLTIGLMALTALIWCDAKTIPGSGLHQEIAGAVIFSTTAALSWWFGDRVHKG